jgi:hypothetical protein
VIVVKLGETVPADDDVVETARSTSSRPVCVVLVALAADARQQDLALQRPVR